MSESEDEREREREEVFETQRHTSGAQHSKKENRRECISPPDQHNTSARGADAFNNSNASVGRERKNSSGYTGKILNREEKRRLLKSIERERERTCPCSRNTRRLTTTRTSESERRMGRFRRAGKVRVSRVFFIVSSREVRRANRIVSHFFKISLSSTRKF